jgi:PAS domain S-box-containing protein
VPDRRANVLLVDDRPENLLALEAVLAPLPCRLVSVTSGQEALRRLLHEEFAVILLDVQMPELDGFETAEYIKRRDKTKAIPIIFVTAISKERHHVFRGYEAGAVDYVFKPYEPAVLRAKVQVFLELHEAEHAVRRSEALLRATFANAPIGMARLDARGTFQEVNRVLCDVLGLGEGALLGKPLDALTVPEDVGVDAEQRADLLAGRLERYFVAKRLRHVSGEVVDAELSFSIAREFGAVLVQVQDVRERRRAQQAREALVREQAARAEAESAAARDRAMRSITDAALGALGLEDLLTELLARITDALAVDAAAITLGDGPEARVVVRTAGEAGVSGPGASGEAGLGESVTSRERVPLLAGDRTIGVLEVGTLFERRFTDADLALLGLAAERAALSIERVRLFEREHQIAQELQRSLLPARLPIVPGLSMAARYLPGGAGTRVGGDWYDTIPLPGGRVALVIGDVAGRGVGAAATMGQLRSALRAYLLDGAAPADALERLNRFLLALGWDSMATALVLVVEPATGRLTYANAGHPPPVVLGAEGVARYLRESLSVPLGALDVPGYSDGTAALEPGATLVLYTDGLVEQRDELLDRGIARLERALVETGGAEPELLCERVIDRTLSGGSDDDVTLLVVRASDVLGERVELELIGEPTALAAFRQALRRWLTELEAAPDEVQEVVMATNEACQNAIEHAYSLAPEPFDVDMAATEDGVELVVRDRGGWTDGDSPDRGRGLPLMRALMDSVEVDHRPTGTRITLRRRLRARAAATQAA